MKAAVGYWRHDTRLESHRDAATLQEKTAEANTVSTLSTKLRHRTIPPFLTFSVYRISTA